jgi:signal transduction histidine kinase
VWSLIALLLYQAHQEAIRSASAAARNLARSLADYESSSIQAIDLSLKYLREDWLRDPASFAGVVDRHQEHLKRERVIQVAVLDAEGWTVFSKLPQAQATNFADREYFNLHKRRATDELHISQPLFGRVTRQWAIQFTRPIRDREGRFAGLIVVAVPPPALENVYNDIKLGPDGVIALVRSDGEILARSGDLAKGVTVSLAGMPGTEPDSPVDGQLRGDSTVDGVERFFAYRRLDNYPLTVYVGQGVDTVLAPYYQARKVMIATGALATLFLFAMAQLLIFRARDKAKAARLEAELLEGERRFLEERERLMLDLHDGCIQSIYAIGLNLANCRRLIDQNPARAAQTIAEVEANLSLVIQDLRAFIAGETRDFSEQEFMAEIERLIPPRDEQRPAFSVDIDPAAVKALNAEQAEHVLRIAREGVSNLIRHAGAGSARLSLQRRSDALCLEVSDDGAGIAAQPAPRSALGLHHITARARKLGGRATVTSKPGEGTRVVVDFPLAPR